MMTSAGRSEFVNFYELLGVPPSADIAEIRRAFIAKAKQHHPDAGGSTLDMQQLNIAYKTLVSPTSKGAYDILHSFHTGTTEPGEYSYQDGRDVNDVTDMSDAEIDSFLNSLLAEYKNMPPEPKPSVKQRMKKLFEI